VRDIFAFEWVLTFAIFRLNNRDTLRERSGEESSNNVLNMQSFRPSRITHKAKTGSTAVNVTVHHTTTADFSRSKHDYDNEPELDKSVRVFHVVVALPD
jgi:hypothetical protein